MTPAQIKLIHTAKRQLRLDEAQYRRMLHMVAGVISSKHLDNRSFENVMAHLERLGFRRRPDDDGHYWRDKVAHRERFADARQVWHIRHLAAKVTYPLESLVAQFSQARTGQVTKLRPDEAGKLIEMLKAVLQRHQAGTPSTNEQEEVLSLQCVGTFPSPSALPAARSLQKGELLPSVSSPPFDPVSSDVLVEVDIPF